MKVKPSKNSFTRVSDHDIGNHSDIWIAVPRKKSNGTVFSRWGVVEGVGSSFFGSRLVYTIEVLFGGHGINNSNRRPNQFLVMTLTTIADVLKNSFSLFRFPTISFFIVFPLSAFLLQWRAEVFELRRFKRCPVVWLGNPLSTSFRHVRADTVPYYTAIIRIL